MKTKDRQEMEQIELNVLISTHNRARVLEQTLKDLQRQTLDPCRWELVIIDNASTDDTKSVLASRWEGLNIVAMYEGIKGKSRALNGALPSLRGRVTVFTDDDVFPSADWLASLLQASVRYRDTTIFCGPIVPLLPPGMPDWLCCHSFASVAFAQFLPGVPEGPLPQRVHPFGANYAIRTAVLRNMKFRLDLGPAEEPFMNEDTEFIIRLRNNGHKVIYLPKAIVQHRISKDKLDISWLFRRAFYYGRSTVVQFKHAVLVPEFKEIKSPVAEIRQFTRGCLLNYYCGQLTQLRSDGLPVESVLQELERLELQSQQHLLFAPREGGLPFIRLSA